MAYLNYTSTSFRSNVTNVTQDGLCPDDDGETKPGGKLPTAPTWYAACGYDSTRRPTAYRYRLRVDEVSYNIAANTGVYNFEFYVATGSTSWNYGWSDTGFTSSVFKYSTDNGASYEENKDTATEDKKVTVNGRWAGSGELTGITNKTYMTVNQVTYLKIAHLDNITLAHKSDGTLNITLEVKFGQSSWSYLPFLQTVSATFAATTIPRDHKIYVRNSNGSWQKGTLYYHDGTSWKTPNVVTGGIYVYNGSSWKKSDIR